MTTLVEIAKRAGVSKSTASNVVRGHCVVAEATRRRVEQAIAELHYHPNAIARSLKSRTSSVLGIVVPDLANPFYAGLVVSVERAAKELHFAVLALNTECLAASEDDAGRVFIERRVEGVIIGGISVGSPLPKNCSTTTYGLSWPLSANPMTNASVSSTTTTQQPWRRRSIISTRSVTAGLPLRRKTSLSSPAKGESSDSNRHWRDESSHLSISAQPPRSSHIMIFMRSL